MCFAREETLTSSHKKVEPGGLGSQPVLCSLGASPAILVLHIFIVVTQAGAELHFLPLNPAAEVLVALISMRLIWLMTVKVLVILMEC